MIELIITWLIVLMLGYYKEAKHKEVVSMLDEFRIKLMIIITKIRVFRTARVNVIFSIALKVYKEKIKKFMIKRSKRESLTPVFWYFYQTHGCACTW